jgi:ornithine carbamoyltransferase
MTKIVLPKKALERIQLGQSFAEFDQVQDAHLCLWGPTTNAFRSWHELATVQGFKITQVCDEQFHEQHPSVQFMSKAPSHADVVITDSWPIGIDHSMIALSCQHLSLMGNPGLLPTPPFTIGREILFDPVGRNSSAHSPADRC